MNIEVAHCTDEPETRLQMLMYYFYTFPSLDTALKIRGKDKGRLEFLVSTCPAICKQLPIALKDQDISKLVSRSAFLK